jgi:hypothetical protein
MNTAFTTNKRIERTLASEQQHDLIGQPQCNNIKCFTPICRTRCCCGHLPRCQMPIHVGISIPKVVPMVDKYTQPELGSEIWTGYEGHHKLAGKPRGHWSSHWTENYFSTLFCYIRPTSTKRKLLINKIRNDQNLHNHVQKIAWFTNKEQTRSL